MDVCQYAHKEEAYIQRQLDKIGYCMMYRIASPLFDISKKHIDSKEEREYLVIKDGVDVETFKAALEKIETAPEDFFALFEKRHYVNGVRY